MITCNRCQKTIVPSKRYPEARFKIGDEIIGLLACDDCNLEFRRGIQKIREDIEAEFKLRASKWRDEWRRNFK